MKNQVLPTQRPSTAVLLCMWQVWVALLLPNLLLVTAQNSSTAYVIHIQSNSFDTNSTNEEVCASDKSTRCMCSNAVMAAQRNKNTCNKSEIFELQNSPLGFCQEALTDLNYMVELRNIDASESGRTVTLTEDELTSTMASILSYLTLFTDILERTIVGVYLKSEEQKCTCLEAYKQWLCTTKLPLYTLATDSCPPNQSDDSDPERECICLENGLTLERRRPCLSVCHRVLQNCPYYNPSEFQPPRKPDSTPCRGFLDEGNTTNEPLEIVYGGFPAFDCPDPQLLRMFNIRNNASERPSYSLNESSCIGSGGSRVLHVSTLTRLSLVALLCVLCVLLV